MSCSVATILLTVFGILMIRSATLDAIDPDLINRVPDQIRFALFGMVVLFGLAGLDYRLLGGLHQWLYLLMVVLLLLVFFFGVEGDAGAKSWVNIGIRVQPSEVAKVLIIVTLGHLLAANAEKMDRMTTIFKSLIHIGIPTAIIFIQPDLGMAIVFGVMWMVMVFAAGLRLKHVAIFALVITLSAPIVLPVAWGQMKFTKASVLRRSSSRKVTVTPTTTSFRRVSALVRVGWSAKAMLKDRRTPCAFCVCATPTSSSV